MRILQRKTYINPPKEIIQSNYSFDRIDELFILNDVHRNKFLIILEYRKGNASNIVIAFGLSNGKISAYDVSKINLYSRNNHIEMLTKNLEDSFWFDSTEKYMVDLACSLSLYDINILIENCLTLEHV